MTPDSFKKLPIMGIVRGGDPQIAGGLVEAVVAAGLETLEVAMNTPRAAEMLTSVADAAGAGNIVMQTTRFTWNCSILK